MEQRHTSVAQDTTRIILGPWALRPVLTFVVLFFVTFYAMNTGIDLSRQPLSYTWVHSFPSSLAVATTTSLLIAAGRRLSHQASSRLPTRTQYLATMVIAGLAGGSVLYLTHLAMVDAQMDGRGWTFYLVRGIAGILLIHAAAGINDERLLTHARRTEEALEEVRQQRHVIADSEERARRLVASFLHDRVQAGLVATSLQIQSIARRTPSPIDRELGSIVEALEELRAEDVRSASRILSPDLDHVGLSSALDDFLGPFRKSIVCDVSIDASLSEWSGPTEGRHRQSLAIYRIIEQAVLNAAAHGRASRIRILLERHGDEISLQVQDDGLGLPTEVPTRGSGLRIVSAWTEMIDGRWRLDRGHPTGAVFSVAFPIASSFSSGA